MRHLKNFNQYSVFDSNTGKHFTDEELKKLQELTVLKSEQEIISKTSNDMQESGQHDIRDIDTDYVISFLKHQIKGK